jgi:hypothetical protein
MKIVNAEQNENYQIGKRLINYSIELIKGNEVQLVLMFAGDIKITVNAACICCGKAEIRDDSINTLKSLVGTMIDTINFYDDTIYFWC